MPSAYEMLKQMKAANSHTWPTHEWMKPETAARNEPETPSPEGEHGGKSAKTGRKSKEK